MQHKFKEGEKLLVRRMVKGKEKVVPFVIAKFLTSGSQAEIYLGHLEGSDQPLVLKFVYGKYSSNPKLYYKKTRMLAAYAPPHPDMVWPIAVTSQTDTGAFAYVMQYLDGFDMFSRIISHVKGGNGSIVGEEINDPRRRPPVDPGDRNDPANMTVQQKAEAVAGAADVIQSLHDMGFMYTDVSGRNAMYKVNPDGHVEVKLLEPDNVVPEGKDGKNNLGVEGSGEYRAPEIISGEGHCTIRSDRHALAVLAFRVFAGSHPLDGAAVHAVPYTEDNVKFFFGKAAEFTITSRHNKASTAVFNHFNTLPEKLQNYFKLMFSPEALHGQLLEGNRDPRLPAGVLSRVLRTCWPEIN